MALFKWFLNTVEKTSTIPINNINININMKGSTGVVTFNTINTETMRNSFEQEDIIKFQLYDYDTTSWDTVFEGFIEKISTSNNFLNIASSDYTKKSQLIKVVETYKYEEISRIVKDLADNYLSDMTQTHIDSTGTEAEMNTQTSTDGTYTMNATNEKMTQKFQPTSNNVIKIDLYIQNNSSGIADIEIREDNSGVPSTTNILKQETNITLSNGWNTIDCTRGDLNTANSYWLVIIWKGGTFDLSTNGTTNTGRVALSTASPESWATQLYNDLAFRTYKTDGKILDSYLIRGKSIFEAYNNMISYIKTGQWIFYIDEDKDIHFHDKDNYTNSYTYTDSNTFKASRVEDSKGKRNKVRVYGGKVLESDYSNEYIGDGKKTVFFIAPTYPEEIKQVKVNAIATTSYTADMVKNTITFDTAPTSGHNIEILCDYRRPIIAESENIAIGDNERTYIKADDSIKSQAHAQDLAEAILTKLENPNNHIKLLIKMKTPLNVGDIFTITNSKLGITTIEYIVMGYKHTISKGKYFTDVDLNVNQPNAIADAIKNLQKEIEDIKMKEEDTTAPLLKLKKLQDEIIVDTNITVNRRHITDSFILDHTENGILGREGEVVNDMDDYTDWEDTWDISTASYDSKSFSVHSQATNPLDFHFKADGTKMYVVGVSSDSVFQYTLSTAWDISTASYDSKSFSVSSQDTCPQSIYLNTDGTKMYMLGNENDSVFQYTLSSAWDISTASYDSKSFSVSSQDGLPRDLYLKSDGTKLYILGGINDTVFQYTLSSAWDISTASYDSKSFSVNSQENIPLGFHFREDGTKMYVIGNTNQIVYQYTLSTAWDISTASYDSKAFSVLSQTQYPIGVFITPNGEKMYIIDNSDDNVYQYIIEGSLSLSDNTNTDYLRVGSKSLKLEWFCLGSKSIEENISSTDYSIITGGNTATKGTIGLHFYNDSGHNIITSIKLTPYSGTDYNTYNANYNSLFPIASEWNYITFDLDNPNVSSSLNWSSITKIKIEFETTESTGTIYLDYFTISESNEIGLNGRGYRFLEREV